MFPPLGFQLSGAYLPPTRRCVGRTGLNSGRNHEPTAWDSWTANPSASSAPAASCHIAMIGDSYVEALQVPIADKFHVRLEELAAEELRHLDITTSAFGIMGTGQVNQLAYYDEFARTLRPALLVLVFVNNDFMNNAPILDGFAAGNGSGPTHRGFRDARRGRGPLRCGRPIPLLRSPDWPPWLRLLHPGIRASRTA